MNISPSTTIASVNTGPSSKTLYLPPSVNISGRSILIKDITGSASNNPITINTCNGDYFQDNTTQKVISASYGFANFYLQSNIWYFNSDLNSLNNSIIIGLSTLSTVIGTGGSSGSSNFGGTGISSLSTIISYGLSSLGGGVSPGISSLSTILSYGLSSLRTNPGVSSLSTILSYGLSSLTSPINPGVSSLSTILSYGLSSLTVSFAASGVSSLSSILSYGLSSLTSPINPGVSSLSSIVSYGLSTVVGVNRYGLSSLSSIVSYGLSSLTSPINPGVSSLSTILSYGVSSLMSPINPGVSSLSSIVSYGLSTVVGVNKYGLSSLSSIVSYGLSSLTVSFAASGISSLSSILSYGLSSISGSSNNSGSGISSLSSILSYGLSSLRVNTGVSSLSTIISYGLSSLGQPINPGVSSLSTILSYGLSSLGGGVSPGISSLSSILSYGLSSLKTPIIPGVSSLSTIISYGLSSFSKVFQTSTLIANNETVSSITVSSICFGSGPGYVGFNAIQSAAISSIQINSQYFNGGLFTGDGSGLSNLPINGLPISTFSTSIGNYFTTKTEIVGTQSNTIIHTPKVIIGGRNSGSYPHNTNIDFFNGISIQNLELYEEIVDAAYSEDLGLWVLITSSNNTYNPNNSGVPYIYCLTSANTIVPANNIESFGIGQYNAVTYGSNKGVGLFVIVGTNNKDNKTILWSSNGFNWYQTQNSGDANFADLRCVAYGNGIWAIGTADTGVTANSILLFNDITGTSYRSVLGGGGFDVQTNYIAYDGIGTWVAVGYDGHDINIQYSTDDLSSLNQATNNCNGTNQFFNGIGCTGTGIAYGNGIWVAVGQDLTTTTNILYYSTDGGLTFTLSTGLNSVTGSTQPVDVKYVDSAWLVSLNDTGQLMKTYDLSFNEWFNYNVGYNLLRLGVGTQPTQVIEDIQTVLTVNGDFRVNGHTLLTSAPANLTQGINDTTMVLIAEDLSGGQQYFVHNNLYPTAVGQAGFTSFKYANGLWVAANSDGNMYYSTNGINFNVVNYPYNSGLPLGNVLFGADYVNNIWVGYGSNIYGSAVLEYSYDGINWSFNNYFNSLSLQYVLTTIIYNPSNSIYYLYGYNPTGTYYTSNILITSNITNSTDICGVNTIDLSFNSVKLNSKNEWVAACSDPNNTNQTVIYSSDGSNWNYAINNYVDNILFFPQGLSVDYGNNIWLVSGTTDLNGYSLYRSSNGGINFNPQPFPGVISCLRYDGFANWYGQDANMNLIYKSSDNGSNWIAFTTHNPAYYSLFDLNGIPVYNTLGIGESPFNIPTEIIIDGRLLDNSAYTGPGAFGTIHMLPNPINRANNIVGITFGANNYYSNAVGAGVEGGAQAGIISQSHGDILGNDSADIHILTSCNFLQGAQDRLVVTGAGNVGINTISPQYTLDVSGNVNLSQNFFISGRQPRYFQFQVIFGSAPPQNAIYSIDISDNGFPGNFFPGSDYILNIVGFNSDLTGDYYGSYCDINTYSSNWQINVNAGSFSTWSFFIAYLTAIPVSFFINDGTTTVNT